MTWMLSLALDAWCSRVCAIVFGVIFGIHTNTQMHMHTHTHTQTCTQLHFSVCCLFYTHFITWQGCFTSWQSVVTVNCVKGTTRETSKRSGDTHTGFSILNWTQLICRIPSGSVWKHWPEACQMILAHWLAS